MLFQDKKRRLDDQTTPLNNTCNTYNLSKMEASNNGIDTNLYSRQIGTFGFEAMGKLIQMRILISGLKGLGVECAKNIILAGPREVWIEDKAIVSKRDLGSNFYLCEKDVGVKTREEACLSQLQELNNYVTVRLFSGPIDDECFKAFDAVIFTDTERSKLIKYNAICRSQTPPVAFVAADCLGLSGFVFVDFGDRFICRDQDGEEPKSAIVAGITHDNPATVHTHTDKRLPFQTGDYVSFSEVLGMTEINEMPPTPIKVTGNNSFTICDTTAFTTYLRGGVVQQVKVPVEIQFKSLQDASENPLSAPNSLLPIPDFGKMGVSEQLHFCIHAVLEYRDIHNELPAIRDDRAVEECLQIAQKLVEKANALAVEAKVCVEELDTQILKKVVYYAKCHIAPMAAYMGGIVSQEIVKFTGKYTPLRQWFYTDAFEALPKTEITDFQPCNSRYDDQIAIWGQSFQKQLENLNLFVVGAGALGCEFLKNFGLMGCCCGGDGLLTITDMDRIEVSNLNRQFLFRMEHVGKSKSKTAGTAVVRMNPDFQINPLELRVGIETEDRFDDDFWESQTIIVNALDNIRSRQYVDERCVWFNKPLLECGTLGTKGNVQVILPHMSQSYSESQDPPEESIPLCTLKHFPHQIEHTIEWARDAFEGLFVNAAQEAELYIQQPKVFLKRLLNEGTPFTQRERLQKILDVIQSASTIVEFRLLVEKACKLFGEFFNHQILQLLYNFPLDHITSSGLPFWSGPKRPPVALELDPADEMILQFVHAAANLFAYYLNLPQCSDVEVVREIVKSVTLETFQPKQLRIKVEDADNVIEGSGDDETVINELKRELSKYTDNLSTIKLCPIEFEKDDDTNFHMAFISACANLRARNYRIPECSAHKAKMIAGKIIPAVATTTAMVSGLVALELIKTVDYTTRRIEDFKNAFINLSLPLWIHSEPVPPSRVVDKEFDPVAGGPVKACPNGFTSWDKLKVMIPGGTVKQLLQYLKRTYNAEVGIISSGNSCLYNGFSAEHRNSRLNKPIKELYQDVTKIQLPEKRKYVVVEVSANDTTDFCDVILPVIRYEFKN